MPTITHAELTKLLVPGCIQSIPEKDGWGRACEHPLNVQNPLERIMMSIRSPGRHGKFEGASYSIAAFPKEQIAQDIVWADRFFVRWPEAKQE